MYEEYVQLQRTVDVTGQPHVTQDWRGGHTFAPTMAEIKLSRYGDGPISAHAEVRGTRVRASGKVGKAPHSVSYWHCDQMPEWLAEIVRTPTPATIALGWDLTKVR